MYNGMRDAHPHGWISNPVESVADEEAMTSRAQHTPEKMTEACELLSATDGLVCDEIHGNTGIGDEKRSEIEGWILNGILAKGVAKRDKITAFDTSGMKSAIRSLREAARQQTKAGAFCGQLLAACFGLSRNRPFGAWPPAPLSVEQLREMVML